MAGALAGLAILVIGDSHMASPDNLVTTLHNTLMNEGAEVSTYAMCASMPGDWIYRVTAPCRAERHGNRSATFADGVAPTWVVSDLIAQNHPDLVIVELADTIAGYDKAELPKPWIQDQVRALVQRISVKNVSCVWIGPSWGNPESTYHKTTTRVKEMSDFLASIVAPCGYIDSTKFAQPGEWRTVDGQGLTHNGYRKWGADIASALVQLRKSESR